MRRTLLAAPLVGAVALVGVLVALNARSPAQPGGRSEHNAKPQAAALPITQIVLFSSGVGYFQREGEVEGNTRIDMTFPVENINDLLKSLVLQDLGGGHVSAVNYDSHDPIDKTLRSFAVNLTDNPTFGQMLQQARGEKIEIVLQQTSVTQPGTLSGTIVGLEHQQQPAGKDATINVELLNLWCADGMRSLKLNEVQRIRFLNPVMDSELRRALETLALAHDTQKKAVSFSFSGQGRRPVRVSYVVENPIWKTSYRLVLDKNEKNNKVFLQGWAVVENTSDEDWNTVRMALVSGRPISFQMDLYQPLYVPRPMVEPELFASLRPQTYSGSMTQRSNIAAPTGDAGLGISPDQPAERRAGVGGRPPKPEGEERLRELKEVADRAHGFRITGGYKESLGKKLDAALELQRGVASAASASEMGDFFQYFIDQPVTLARQKSALLPIVNQNVEGTRVSIYNQQVHAKFPLHGLKFKNTTDLHLMQGPITVFDGSNYAGDARIQDLQPKEERLLSYAIDLGTEVEPVVKQDPQRLIAVKIVKGILHATNKVRESKTYNIKNRATGDRTLIIEHPYRQDFKLVTPAKASERSQDVYRFELPVAAGKAAGLEIVEEKDFVQQVSLSNSDDQSMRFFLNSTVASAKVKDVLTKAIELKSELALTQRDLADRNRQLQDINQDQGRLRANLREMPPTAAAYKRYLEKFDKQETEIEQLQDEIKRLREKELKQKNEYDAYLAGINVE